MGLFRIQHTDFEQRLKIGDFDTLHKNEWEDTGRLNNVVWQQRYDYECDLITEVITYGNIKSILELGSGPGILSQKIQEKVDILEYHLIDKPFAKKYFEEHNFKGRFFTKDMSDRFDTSELSSRYDLVIANDFLEHVLNPSAILQGIRNLVDDKSFVFISNPNWRMSHQYIYRGLFDFDNFVYLFYTHGFKLEGFYGSQLKTPNYPRISSETLLPDEHLTDWNHYMLFSKREDY